MKSGIFCLVILSVCLFGVIMPRGSAEAAVRVCAKHVTSKVVVAPHKRDAKRAAIMDWLEKSKSARIRHPSWRVANFKVLKCVASGKGYECIAHAAPCTIKQKAPRRQKPKRRRRSEDNFDV